jgi:hypothetical protein
MYVPAAAPAAGIAWFGLGTEGGVDGKKSKEMLAA